MLCGVALALGVLAIAPAVAAADTINFDDRAPSETVNSQYSSQGVTFNGPIAYSHPGLAHSGSMTVENCFSVEFCGSPPIRADFTTGQTLVGAWVGNTDGTQTRAVRLTAYDSGGTEVGHADASMAAGSPASHHLTVTVGSPTIRALEVTPTDGLGSYDLIVDDVEFSSAGPPPPCNASAPPTVSLTSPANNTYLQNNTVLLKGNVNTHGAPITSARVVSEGSTTRTRARLPDADQRQRAATSRSTWAACFRPATRSSIVTATNCAGTGASTNPIVTYNPLPDTAGFQQLAPIEVTQTVQSPLQPGAADRRRAERDEADDRAGRARRHGRDEPDHRRHRPADRDAARRLAARRPARGRLAQHGDGPREPDARRCPRGASTRASSSSCRPSG